MNACEAKISNWYVPHNYLINFYYSVCISTISWIFLQCKEKIQLQSNENNFGYLRQSDFLEP